MSNRTLAIDDRIYDYLLSVSVDESELLARLRQETLGVEWSVMQISPEQGQFMSLLVRLLNVKRALEVGTYTGYSSICIASALAEGGQLLCCDDSEEWTAVARKYWKLAGLENKIQLQLQDASKTLQMLVEQEAGTFDFIFIDADKQNYEVYYEYSLSLLRKGGLLAVDNTLWSGKVADEENNEPGTRAIRRFNDRVKNDTRVTQSLVPIGDGLTLIYRQ